MEKHKYTPVRLTSGETAILKSFINEGGPLVIQESNIPEPMRAAFRQLYRLGLIDKSKHYKYGYQYLLSPKGEAYLNRPRIKIKFRYNRLGQTRIIYKILKGTVYLDKSYQQITRTLFLKVV